MDENPELIQEGDCFLDEDEAQTVPAFLIHDGGGTTFAYHCLDPLGRPIYGIFNPYFRSGGSFEGGLSGMGRLYAKIIKDTVAEPDFPSEPNADGSVDILLGGWSMGGMLSLEVAQVLAEDTSVRVIGILFIDTMCTSHLPTTRLAALESLDLGDSKNGNLSLQAMKEGLRCIYKWQPPVWEGKLAGKRPRISLVRAANPIPTNSEDPHLVDLYRDTQTLGWDLYDNNMFTDIVEVEGNHFNMFQFDYIPAITEVIKTCFDTLELMRVPVC